MTNNIVDAISVQLFEIFGAEYAIYTENVEQDLQEPCFFIDVVDARREKIIGQRYYSNNTFDICYFSNEEERKKDFRNVGDALMDEMEYISLANGDLLHATNMRCEVIDDVLHFLVDYNLIAMKEMEPYIDMENATIDTSINKE